MLKQILLLLLITSQGYLALGQTRSLNLTPQEAQNVKSRIERATSHKLFCLRQTLVPGKKVTYKKESYFTEAKDLPFDAILLTMKSAQLINQDIPDREFDIVVMSNERIDQPAELVLRFNRHTFEFISYSFKRSKMLGVTIKGSQVIEDIQLQVEESCS